MNYEAQAGENISTAAAEMVKLAKKHQTTITCQFNDRTLVANPANGDTADSIVSKFHDECEQSRKKYEESPAGKLAAQRQKDYEAKAAQAESEGILPFSVIPEHQAEWDKAIKNNDDPYGACTVRYAARWANYMELAMAKGETIKDCAGRCSHEADKEGITGFMYGCAVSMLAQCWTNGEALRLWHNLKTQIKDEGEKANASGGVLNPALLSIG